MAPQPLGCRTTERRSYWSTVIHCSVGEYGDFELEEDVLWNAMKNTLKNGKRVRYELSLRLFQLLKTCL